MKKNKVSIYVVSAMIVTAFAAAGFSLSARANQYVFPPTIATASATSTLIAMTPGTATTTLTYDSYASYTSSTATATAGQPIALDSATVLFIQTSSSSAAVLNMSVQYSQNGIDWYGDSINNNATTSSPALVSSLNSFRSNGSATASTTFTAYPIKTPTRYMRVQFSDGIVTGLGNLLFFAQITPTRQGVK